MRDLLSKYKFKKIAVESLKNGIRLHFDSILLYKNHSFPTSLQISIIALEEISKAKWVEHYYYSSITNCGFPEKKFEQKWLNYLFIHPKKQAAFFAQNIFEYSPRFVEFAHSGQLENQKQKATYVGLEKIRKDRKVDVNSRISIPSKVKKASAKKLISLLNDELIDMCKSKLLQDSYFGIQEMDDIINNSLLENLMQWPYKSGIKSSKWIVNWKLNSDNN